MAQATTSPPSCLICKGGKSDVSNYLLTCVDCGRSWHHQCHQPPIPQQEMEALLRSYLASSRQLRLPWRCRKCMRKKATVGQQPNSSESGIPVGYPQEPTVPRPYPPESWPNRPTAGPEVIDLTESPAAPRLRRRVDSGAQAVEIVDLSKSSIISTPVPTAGVIDLSDSPQLQPAELLPPGPPANLPEVPSVDISSMDVDADGVPPSVHISPSLSELALPGTPDTIVHFPSMEVDDIDQKPLSLLLQKLTVSDRPQGGSLGPAWMRERYEATGQMALWKRYVEKQDKFKPLSRRKPEKTARFMGRPPETFVVLPFVQGPL